MLDIAENFRRVNGKIAAAASGCGRCPDDVILLAISKTFPVETISLAIAAGQRRFGENRVQEAESKIPHFCPISGLEWHLVGHLQSNKAYRAAQLFDVVHSVDSIKIVTRLSQASAEIGKQLSILLQVDLGQESTKSGADRTEVRQIVEAISWLKGVSLDGLMTIPPFFEDPELTRPYFAELRQVRDAFESEQPGCMGRQHLSMGMSHDFEVAIQEGATIVRVGTALFGDRTHG